VSTYLRIYSKNLFPCGNVLVLCRDNGGVSWIIWWICREGLVGKLESDKEGTNERKREKAPAS